MASLEVGYLRQGPDVTTHQLYSIALSTIPCSLLSKLIVSLVGTSFLLSSGPRHIALTQSAASKSTMDWILVLQRV